MNKYYHTEWMEENDLPVKLEGLDIDAVYENFVKQIAGDKLQAVGVGEALKDTIIREEEKEALRKQIANLQAKIKKEKQLNKQMQLNGELKRLKKTLEMI